MWRKYDAGKAILATYLVGLTALCLTQYVSDGFRYNNWSPLRQGWSSVENLGKVFALSRGLPIYDFGRGKND